MPETEYKDPNITDVMMTLWKLLVSSLAVTGGITTAAAINVTPSIWIDTTTVAAKISEKIVSIITTGRR